MGLIREPLDVDFTVDPRPLTKEEKNAISDYIRDYKMKDTTKKMAIQPSKNNLRGKSEQIRH